MAGEADGMSSGPRRFVFGIGLNKTGTSSVHEALRILGYRSQHWGGPQARALVRQAMAEGKPMLHYLDPELEAVFDLEEVTYNFELADAQYPGARFILTVRDLEGWVESRRRHVESNRLAKAAGKYHGPFLEIDVDAWVADYLAHAERVRDHFRGRPNDLLELDIAAGDGWEPLCEFLGHEVPGVPFPAQNRYAPWSGTARGRTRTPAPGQPR
jgi:Sulfotransferase domain